MLAARTGNVAVAKLLVQHGADVNRREQYRDQSAVMWAAAQGHADMVAFLVAQKADLTIRAKDNYWMTQISSEPRVQYRPTGGLTPLLYAARAGCLACVTAMVQAGADVDRPNPDGMTPMIMALDNGYPGGRPLPARPRRQPAHLGLVGPHAALRRRDDARGTGQPSGAAGLRRRWRSSTALLEAGVNPNAQLAFKEPSRGGRDNRFGDDLLTTGATPLLRAAQTFDNDVVRLLLAHGARVDLPTASGVTPFMAAAGIGTRIGSSVLGPGRARERGQAVTGNHGAAARGRRGRERPHHRRHQPDRAHRADQHLDGPAGSDHVVLRGRDRDGPRWSGICSSTAPRWTSWTTTGKTPIDAAKGDVVALLQRAGAARN